MELAKNKLFVLLFLVFLYMGMKGRAAGLSLCFSLSLSLGVSLISPSLLGFLHDPQSKTVFFVSSKIKRLLWPQLGHLDREIFGPFTRRRVAIIKKWG